MDNLEKLATQRTQEEDKHNTIYAGQQYTQKKTKKKHK